MVQETFAKFVETHVQSLAGKPISDLIRSSLAGNNKVDHHRAVEMLTDNNFALNSNNLLDAIEHGQIPELANGTLDMAALLGSTNSDWRKNLLRGVVKQMIDAGIINYDPDMGNDWNPALHPKAEAEALTRATVLGIRLENAPGNIDGSLGSLVEIGVAIYSAILRGQRVVISIDEKFESSLSDEGALAQFEALKRHLSELRVTYPNAIEYLDGENGSPEKFSEALKHAMQLQRNSETQRKPITLNEIQQFAEKRKARLSKERYSVTISGSSDAMSESLDGSFGRKQLISKSLWRNHNYQILHEGPIASFWQTAYTAKDSQTKKDLLMQGFSLEQGPKKNADVLVWTINEEAISQAAVTEIGFLLLDALSTGQQVIVLLEPFNPDLYAAHRMRDEIPLMRREIESMRAAGAQQVDVDKALAILQDFEDGNLDGKITYKFLKSAGLLTKTSTFKKAENVRRVRSIAEHQLAQLQKEIRKITGDTGIELFAFATDITDYIQKSELINGKEQFDGREQFYESYKRFNGGLEQRLDTISADTPEGEGRIGDLQLPAQIIDEALSAVNPREKRFQGLVSHLEQVTAEAKKYQALLLKHQDPNNPFISEHNLELLVNIDAPLHDILKFLGNPEVQSIPDHEILIGDVCRRVLERLGYPPEDITFVVSVVADHENLFKEVGRAAFASSTQEVERAKSLFFVMDTLTGAVNEVDGVLTIDDAMLNKRFTDLYFRHISHSDFLKGKVFRPQWGVYALNDFLAFFQAMEKQGMQLQPGFFQKLTDAALAGITQALAYDQERITYNANLANKTETLPVFSESELDSIEKSRSTLAQLRASLPDGETIATT